MKLGILVLIFITISCAEIKAQNAYYDALFVASLRKEDFNDLSSLSDGEAQILKELSEFQNNPFDTKKVLPDFARSRVIFHKLRAQGLFATGTSSLAAFQATSLLSPLLNLSKLSTAQLDTVLYGLIIYFADEFRRNYLESYMWSFDRSIGRLGELQILFPATYNKMRSFDPIRYKELGNELKLVFDEDLGTFPDNLINHLESTDSSRFNNKNFLVLNDNVCRKISSQPSFKYFKVSSLIAKKLIHGVHPSDIIASLDETYYRDPALINGASEPLDEFGRQAHFLNILQRNLRDTVTNANGQSGNIWINFEKLGKLNTAAKQGYFMALLYREDPAFFDKIFSDETYRLSLPNAVDFSGLKDPAQFGNVSYTARFNTFKRYEFDNILSILIRLDEFIRTKNKDLMTEQNFLPLMKMTGEIVNLALLNPTDRAKAKQYLTLINNSFEVYNAIRVKNYANLTTHIGTILDLIVSEMGGATALAVEANSDFINLLRRPSTYRELRNSLKNVEGCLPQSIKRYIGLKGLILKNNTSLSPTDVEDIVKKALSRTSKATSVQELIQRLDKATAFSSGIVSATASEGIKNIISQFASPPSSYREKREHFFSVSLGGMPGLFIGGERFVKTQVEETMPNSLSANKTSFITGLSLPVGFDFTLSFNRDRQSDIRKKVWSWGLFASFLDLGAMLNYRLTSNSNTLPDKVEWKDILSPGICINAGLPNTPLTIGLGYQYAPKLRGITEKRDSEVAVENRFNANRVQLRIAYDIPIFNIAKTRR